MAVRDGRLRRPAASGAAVTANVVDSSGWLEYVDGGPNARAFEPAILAVERLVVPSICLLEVFKRMLREKGEDAALDVVGQMRQGVVVDLDADLALEAARLGRELRLPLADSVIVAIARLHSATIWTQDQDFEGMDGVRYFPKRERSPR
ncbi:MAG: type II toxin-antitoxin system VapC family toxin [Gemmatimonadaceae bacterium]